MPKAFTKTFRLAGVVEGTALVLSEVEGDEGGLHIEVHEADGRLHEKVTLSAAAVRELRTTILYALETEAKVTVIETVEKKSEDDIPL